MFRWWIAAIWAVQASVAIAAAPTFAGQRVVEVLERLRTEGLTFIYNSEIVPRQLLVDEEPKASTGLELAREVLRSHGLTVTQVAPGVYTVVAEPKTPVAPAVANDVPPPSAAAPIEEIVVNTSRYTFAAAGTSHTFLTQDELQSMPRLADEPLRAVSRLPGVTNNGFSALGQIRGGETNETAIVLDGLRLYEPFHLKNFLSPVSLLDSRLVDSIEVYAGGFPAMYGGRISGVIEATSIRPAGPRYYEAGLSLFHTSGLAAADFADGRGKALVSLRASNLGLLSKASESDFGTPNYSDAFTKLEYQFDATTRGSLQALFSSDRILALRDRGTQRAKAQYHNAYTWATLEHAWSPAFSSRAIASLTEITNERRGTIDNPGQRSGRVADEREFQIAGLQLDNSWHAGSVDQHFGLSLQYLTGDYDYNSSSSFAAGFPFPGSPAVHTARSSAVDPAGTEISGYWDVRVRPIERLTVAAGVRIDRQTYGDDDGSGQVSPRLSLLYEVGPNTVLRTSWGSYSQAQGINELQVEDGIERFHRPQYAEQLIASVDHDFRNGIQLRVEGYRKDYRRLATRFENLFDTLVILPELEPDRVRLDPSSARSEGLEVLLKVAPRNSLSGWLSYAISRVTDRIGGRDFRRSWDQRNAVSAGLSWFSGPWSASANYTYHTGWPTTGLDVVTDTSGSQRVVPGERNAQRFGNFNSLDLRLTRTFALTRGALDVFIEASNALSQTNPCCVEYDVDRVGNMLEVRADIDNWLPLVPSAGVLWHY